MSWDPSTSEPSASQPGSSVGSSIGAHWSHIHFYEQKTPPLRQHSWMKATSPPSCQEPRVGPQIPDLLPRNVHGRVSQMEDGGVSGWSKEVPAVGEPDPRHSAAHHLASLKKDIHAFTSSTRGLDWLCFILHTFYNPSYTYVLLWLSISGDV
jgi:hypothetical protein